MAGSRHRATNCQEAINGSPEGQAASALFSSPGGARGRYSTGGAQEAPLGLIQVLKGKGKINCTIFKILEIFAWDKSRSTNRSFSTYHMHHHLDSDFRILVDVVLALGDRNRRLVKHCYSNTPTFPSLSDSVNMQISNQVSKAESYQCLFWTASIRQKMPQCFENVSKRPFRDEVLQSPFMAMPPKVQQLLRGNLG